MSKLLSETPDVVVTNFGKATEDLIPGSIFTVTGKILDKSRGGSRPIDATVSGVILSAYSVEDKDVFNERPYMQRYVRLTDGALLRENQTWI